MLNGYVSDLFFNLDHSDNKKIDEDGMHAGFDDEKLLEEAKWFSDAIKSVSGGTYDYTPAEIVEDFHKRV